MNHGPGHFTENGVIFRLPVLQKGDDLGNILRLIADSLHVGDHFQSGGDLPQVPGHGLLLEQQPQTKALNVPLLAVDLTVHRRDLFRQRPVALCQGLGGQRDDLLAQRAHFDHLVVELGQLFVKTVSHVIRTSR